MIKCFLLSVIFCVLLSTNCFAEHWSISAKNTTRNSDPLGHIYESILASSTTYPSITITDNVIMIKYHKDNPDDGESILIVPNFWIIDIRYFE